MGQGWPGHASRAGLTPHHFVTPEHLHGTEHVHYEKSMQDKHYVRGDHPLRARDQGGFPNSLL